MSRAALLVDVHPLAGLPRHCVVRWLCGPPHALEAEAGGLVPNLPHVEGHTALGTRALDCHVSRCQSRQGGT
jgi:hypothetical protein